MCISEGKSQTFQTSRLHAGYQQHISPRLRMWKNDAGMEHTMSLESGADRSLRLMKTERVANMEGDKLGGKTVN